MAREKKTLIVNFDSEKNKEDVRRSIDGLSIRSGVAKGTIAQRALEKAVLPQTQQVRSWADAYYQRTATILGIMARFFRRVESDVLKGRNRFNCLPVVEEVYEYLFRYCDKSYEDFRSGLWPRETISLYRQNWQQRKAIPDTYEKIASILEALDEASVNPSFHVPPSDVFAPKFFLVLDGVVKEWDDAASMSLYEDRSLKIPINCGKDILILPYSDDVVVLNPLDAEAAKNATVISMRNKGILDIPHFVYLSELPTGELSRDALDRIDAAIASICPDYAEALAQKVPLKRGDDGDILNLDQFMAAPEPGYFPVSDAGIVYSDDSSITSRIRIVRQERR